MNLYHPTGIFTAGYPLEERNAFIERWVKEYDERHPGNTLLRRQKKRYARACWHRHIMQRRERDRKLFEAVA